MKSAERTPLTLETALYLAAFMLALGLRLLNLGAAPLSDGEAAFALQAYELAQGSAADLDPQPAYTTLTGMIFWIFKASNSTARLIPALAGSFLVFLPLLFRPLGGASLRLRLAGLILAFGLALDPALTALARQAGSPILALACLSLAAGCAWRHHAPGTGILAGLALLSGPPLATGLLGLGATILAARFLSQKRPLPVAFPAFETENDARAFAGRSLLYAGGTVLAAGLLWLALPQALAGIANLIPLYLAGWVQPSGIPALRLPLAILLYQPLVAVFSLAALLRAWLRPGSLAPVEGALARWLSVWALAALLAALALPARQVADAVWALPPLWALTALELSRLLTGRALRSQPLPTLGMAGGFLLFLLLIGYNLLRLDNLQAQPILYAAIIGGLVLMGVIVFVLVALGGYPEAAWTGLAGGVAIWSGVYMFAALWGMSQLRMNQPEELWMAGAGSGNVAELMQTIQEFSRRQTGHHQEIEVAVNVPSPALRWELRNFPKAAYLRYLPSNPQAAIVLSEAAPDLPALASRYRGQELVWRRTPAWTGLLPPDLLRWLAFRELPVAPQTIILWVRADLFPDQTGADAGESSVPAP